MSLGYKNYGKQPYDIFGTSPGGPPPGRKAVHQAGTRPEIILDVFFLRRLKIAGKTTPKPGSLRPEGRSSLEVCVSSLVPGRIPAYKGYKYAMCMMTMRRKAGLAELAGLG